MLTLILWALTSLFLNKETYLIKNLVLKNFRVGNLSVTMKIHDLTTRTFPFSYDPLLFQKDYPQHFQKEKKNKNLHPSLFHNLP